MKILFLTLFLYFSLLATYNIYAGNSTLLISYPAPSGSYNQVQLSSPQTQPNCLLPNNAGLLFLDLSSNQLEVCANNQASPVTVTYPETCYTRFCSDASASGGVNNCPDSHFNQGLSSSLNSPCVGPYTQAMYQGLFLVDQFSPSSGITVYTTVCCNTGSVNNLPAVPSTVVPPT